MSEIDIDRLLLNHKGGQTSNQSPSSLLAVAHEDALVMTSEEDRAFLLARRKPGWPVRMDSMDKKLANA